MPQPLSELKKTAHTFLFNRGRAEDYGKIRDEAKAFLKDWFLAVNTSGRMVNGEVDDKGNRTLWFDDPLTIGDVTYTGVQAQRKEPTPVIDTDAAADLLREKGSEFYEQVFKRQVTRVFSEDDLYTLNQEGVVTDDELDALLVVGNTSYAIVVVKG